jgi:hypothetical protein
MDKGAQGWLYRTAHKNYWRVANWYSFDDLVQDGFVCWYGVQARYVRARPGVPFVGGVKDKKHVMSLFKTTYTNHIHDLAKFATRQLDAPTYDGEPASSLTDDYAEMCRIVAEAPPLVRDAIEALLRGRTRSLHRRRSDGTRQKTSEKLCEAMEPAPTFEGQVAQALALVGVVDIRKEIYAYLTS